MKILCPLLFLVLTACRTPTPTPDTSVYPDPARFESSIREYEERDAASPPKQGAIHFLGSSSIVGWHPYLKEDFAPLDIVGRGFGGSTMYDALYYVERLVLPHRPDTVVVYEGDNDIANGVQPETIAATARALADRIHADLPETRIVFLSVKPSPDRWHLWSDMKKTNRLLQQLCGEDDRLIFVDVSTPMLDDRGQPRPELYKADQLHMTRVGYKLWRGILRPVLLNQ